MLMPVHRAELAAEECAIQERRRARFAAGLPSSSPEASSEEEEDEGELVELAAGFVAADFEVVDGADGGDGIHLLSVAEAEE